MHSYIQFITTPTADTEGTAFLFDIGKKRYLFGNIHEGLQRACIQRNARLAKTTDVFVTGKTEWKNIGGLFGVILTLADANASAAQSETENVERRKKEETVNQTVSKISKRAKLDEERSKIFKEAGLNPEEFIGTSEKEGNAHVSIPTLTVHGAKNITHMVATGRRFIFRKGMPIQINEHIRDQDSISADQGRDPDWVDDSIQVWKLSVEPSKDNRSPEIAPEPHRKRVFEEFTTGNLHSPCKEEATRNSENDEELRKSVVSEMFSSQWRLDTLIETPLSKVQLPAFMWIRNKETGQLERYYIPKTGPLPDINVLVRRPWPGALVDRLPPTQPSQAAMSYIIRHYPQKGKFNPAKAKALKVHQLVFQALQRGLTVKSQDGTTVTPDMVLEPSRIGGGFAVVDLPSRDYLRSLLNRPEWKMPRIMDGLQTIVWNLGRGVADDPALRSFLIDHITLKHIVSSSDITPNYLAFDSSSALVIRLNQIDSQRYPIPIHSNSLGPNPLLKRVDNTKYLEPYVATRDLQLQLEPCWKMQEAPGAESFLDTRNVIEGTPKEVLELAQNVRSSVTLKGQHLRSEDAEIICLGTGSSAPSKYRNVSATLLRVPGSGSYLFDCGEGTLGQLKRLYESTELREVLRDLKAIWISHLHADHHLGITSVIKAWYKANHIFDDSGLYSNYLDQRPVGPSDILNQGDNLLLFGGLQMINWLKEYSSVEDFGYNKLIAITTSATNAGMDWNGIEVGFQTKDASINQSMRHATGMTTLKTCGVAHCYDAQAISVTFPTGFKFSYSGDCRPSSHFVYIGQGSTVLVHEATFDDDMRGDAEAKKHSTMSEAIGVAQAMGAKRLVLTHFSQRYQKIPLLGALENISVNYDDPGTISSEAEEADVSGESENVGLTTNSNDQYSPSRMPTSASTKPVRSSHSPPRALINPDELKVAIAFDFLRVRVGEIEQLEKFTPVLQRMFELLEEQDREKAKDHPSEVARRKKEEDKQRKRQNFETKGENKKAQKRADLEKVDRRQRNEDVGEEERFDPGAAAA